MITSIGTMFGSVVTGNSASALSTAATWLAFGFVVPTNRNLTTVTIAPSSVTGTPLAADITAELYSDSSANPSASIAGPANANANPAGSVQLSFSLSYALVGGTQYWIVFKCPNSPTRYVTIGHSNPVAVGYALIAGSTFGLSMRRSTDSGATWPTTSSGIGGFFITDDTGAMYGLPWTNGTSNSSYGIYGAREAGVLFTADAQYNIIGGQLFISKTGSPSASFRIKLYEDTTLVRTSFSITPAQLTSNTYVALAWDTPYVAIPGRQYRIIGSEETNADASVNRYNVVYMSMYGSNDFRSIAPFGSCLTYWDGSSWAELNQFAPPFAMLVSPGGNEINPASLGPWGFIR